MGIGNYGSKTVTGAVTVTTTPTLVVAANLDRRSCMINIPVGVTVYLGKDNTVSSTNGYPVTGPVDFSDTHSVDDWWGVVTSGTADLRVVEVT